MSTDSDEGKHISKSVILKYNLMPRMFLASYCHICNLAADRLNYPEWGEPCFFSSCEDFEAGWLLFSFYRSEH